MIYMNLSTPRPRPSMRTLGSWILDLRTFSSLGRQMRREGQRKIRAERVFSRYLRLFEENNPQNVSLCKSTYVRWSLSKKYLTLIYLFRSCFARSAKESLDIVVELENDWTNYVQDRQWNTVSETAVTAVWEMSSERGEPFDDKYFLSIV